jgi:Trypsin-like peptidase domain
MGNLSAATFYPRPRVGDQVATYGFPYSGILSRDGNCTLGHVTSLSGARDDTRFLQMSTPVQPGNSGGALLDMSGGVVGLVVAQLNALPQSNPQNVNFALQPSMGPAFEPAKCPQSAHYSSETRKRRFVSECVVGATGIEPVTPTMSKKRAG